MVVRVRARVMRMVVREGKGKSDEDGWEGQGKDDEDGCKGQG